MRRAHTLAILRRLRLRTSQEPNATRHRAIALLLFTALCCGAVSRVVADSGEADVSAKLVPAKVEIQPGKPGTTQPSTVPTQPATQPAIQLALPPEYAIFQTRNAFMRGKGGPSAAGPSGPEAGFVLRGVVQMGDRLIAFVEDRAAKHVAEVSAGEPIARGKIATINFDGIEYQAAGPAKQIKVGQDLNGQVVPPTPTSKPAAPPGQPQPGQEMPPGTEGQPGAPMEGPPGAPRQGKSRVVK